MLRECVRQQPDLALTVRYHPSDWHTFPRSGHQQRVHFSEPPVESIHPLILASDVVVVQTSTVGLEAAVAGRPVISIENSPAAHTWFSLADQQVSTPCASPGELPTVLGATLSDRSGSAKTAYRSDGAAAGRVADVVRRALGDRSAARQ